MSSKPSTKDLFDLVKSSSTFVTLSQNVEASHTTDSGSDSAAHIPISVSEEHSISSNSTVTPGSSAMNIMVEETSSDNMETITHHHAVDHCNGVKLVRSWRDSLIWLHLSDIKEVLLNSAHDASPAFDEKTLDDILESLNHSSELMIKCQGLLTLAHNCVSSEHLQILRKSGKLAAVLEVLKLKPWDEYTLVFYKALFVLVLSVHQLELDEAEVLQHVLSEYLRSLNKSLQKKLMLGENYNIPFYLLPIKLQEVTSEVFSRVLPPDEILPVLEVNLSFLCCTSLRNMSAQEAVLRTSDFFNHNTMSQMLDSFHSLVLLPTFSLTAPLGARDSQYEFHVVSVLQFLQFFERALAYSPENRREILETRNNIFLKYISRLLAFALKALFPDEHCNAQSADDVDLEKIPSVITKHVFLHRSCVVFLLRILVLFYRHKECMTFPFPASLVEKLLICLIQSSYSRLYNKFELTIMTLELLVNVAELELLDRRHFAKLCLMKFTIGEMKYASLEILIKILIVSLRRVEVLKKENDAQELPPFEVYLHSSSVSDYGIVYQVAEEHMEHSFICSYLCVWISLFCDIKEPFFEYVVERIPGEVAKLAITVLLGVMDFLPIVAYETARVFPMLDRAVRIFRSILVRSS